LYDLAVQHETEERILYPYRALDEGEVLPFNHLPFEAFLVAPLLFLSYTGIFLSWTLLLALALCTALYILQCVLPLRSALLVIMIGCAISYQPVFRAFVLGQNSAIVLLGLVLTYAASRSRGRYREAWAGFGLVLVALKPQILPLLLLLILVEGRWQVFLWFCGEFAALVLACMPVLGVGWPLQYMNLLLQVGQWQDSAAIDPAIMHNWRGFAANTIGSLSPPAATITYAGLAVLSLLLLVSAWWRVHVQNRRVPQLPGAHTGSNDAAAANLLWALAVVTAILIAPHLNPHDLMLLIMPGWILVHTIQKGDLMPKLRALCLNLLRVIYLVMVVAFFSGGDSAIWVILNVSLLACSTWLLFVTIKVDLRSEGPRLT
jgi:hypothetical protein